MKLGFISSILESSSFEEVIDTASELGYECVEAACWPKEKAARRYAGITHIDIEALTENRIAYIKQYCLLKMLPYPHWLIIPTLFPMILPSVKRQWSI